MSNDESVARLMAAAKAKILGQRSNASISHTQNYLSGFRGLLVIASFLWTFLQTFVPALVYDVHGPAWQIILRKVLSVIFWDTSLIYSGFIILSARTVCLSFLRKPSSVTLARTVMTRPLQIGVPISIALGISIAIFSNIDTTYIAEAAYVIGNPVIQIPSKPKTSVAAMNAIYDLLWVQEDYGLQQGNLSWPTANLWAVCVTYAQSSTVFLLMIIFPFTRPSWHVKGMLLFGLGCFWFNTWGWYSVGGLYIADISLNPALRSSLTRRITTWRVLASLSVVVGVVLKYCWVIFPQHIDVERSMHPAKFFSEKGRFGNPTTKLPYPRLDNFLIICGLLLLLELSSRLKIAFSSRLLVMLGNRSMSLFVAQSLIVYTVGLKVFVHLIKGGLSLVFANVIVLCLCLVATVVAGEAFHRSVGRFSKWFAPAVFDWTRR